MLRQKLKKFTSKLTAITMIAWILLPGMTNLAYASGTVTVTVNPASGTYDILNLDETPYTQNHTGSKMFLDVPNGDYIVRFKDIGGGFIRPADDMFTVTTGSNAVASGTYQLQGSNGSLVVDVTPDNGTYWLEDLVGNDNYGVGTAASPETGDKIFTDITYGDFLLKFGSIGGGFNPPADVFVSFSASDPVQRVEGSAGTYTQTATSGTLTIDVNPDNGLYWLEDLVGNDNYGVGTAASPETGDKTFTNITFGDFVLKFADLGDGSTPPSDVNVSFSASSANVTVSRTYTPPAVDGTINVDVSPDTAQYYITDLLNNDVAGLPTSAVPATGDNSYSNVIFGDYIIHYLDLGDGTVPPSGQALTEFGISASNPTANVVGDYSTVQIQVVDENNAPVTVPAGSWEVQECDDATPLSCTTQVATGGASPASFNATTGKYYRAVLLGGTPPAGFSNQQILSLNPQQLTAGALLTHTFQFEVAKPDVAITAFDVNPTAGVPGVTTLTYTLTYDNISTVDTVNSATFTIPFTGTAELDTASFNFGTNNCSYSAPNVTCSVPAIVASDPATDIVFTVPVDASATIGNTVDASASVVLDNGEVEASMANNGPVSASQVTIGNLPDVAITAFDVTPTTGVPGSSVLTYTLTYDNLGTADTVNDATFTIPFTGTAELDTASFNFGTNNCSYSAPNVTCTVAAADLEVADPATDIVFTVPVDASATDGNTVDASASVVLGGGEVESSTSNNGPVNASTVTIADLADLEVTNFTASPTTADLGQTITYQFTYDNVGSVDTANDATFTIPFTGTAELDTASFNFGTNNCSYSAPNVTCTVAAPIAAADPSVDISFTVDIDSAATPGNTVDATVTGALGGGELEGTLANNGPVSASQVNIASLPDITVNNFTVNPSAGNNPDVITYSFDYDNVGNSDPVNDATFVVQLTGADSEFTTGSFNFGTNNCSYASPNVTCTVAATDLEVADPVGTISFTVPVDAGATSGNTVTSVLTADLLGGEAESNDVNNVINPGPTFTVGNFPDIAVTNPTASPATVSQGQTVTYGFTYDNVGNADAVNDATFTITFTNLTTTLDETTFDFTGTNCSYPGSGNDVTCTVLATDLEVTDPATNVTFTVDVNSAANGGDTADATISAVLGGGEVESSMTNNGPLNYPQVTVASLADMVINSFTPSSVNPVAGETITYTLNYDNIGSLDTANDATFTIPFTGAAELDTASFNFGTNNCSYNGSTTTVTCTVAAPIIASDPATDIVFTVDVDANATVGNTVDASASVALGGGEPEVSLANNGPIAALTVTITAPEFTITKTADITSVTDGDFVTYTIEVTRNIAGANIFLDISDSVDATDSIDGASGGSLDYILNSGTCAVTGTGLCDPANLQLSDGAVRVRLDANGDTATLTYRTRADNSGVADNGNSVATNTATADYTDLGGSPRSINAQENVTILGNVVSGGGGGSSSSYSSGGGGGGHTAMRGSLGFDLTKQVSLDGVNFKAVDENIAFEIPEHQESTIYNRVSITNTSGVSITKLKLLHHYAPNEAGIDFVSIGNVKNAKFDSSSKIFTIDKVKAGETYTFEYAVTLSDWNSSPEYAEEYVEVVSYTSSLPRTQDYMKRVAIGNQAKVFVYAGPTLRGKNVSTGTSVAVNGNDVRIEIADSQPYVAAGDAVTSTIKITNTSGSDLTGLIITFDYDSALYVSNKIGGKDNGRNVTWKRVILRPGQTATYSVSLEANAGEGGGRVARNLVRVLTSEAEGIAPVESLLTINADVIPKVSSSRPYRLAQTGPAGIFIYLLGLAVIGFILSRRLEEYRYKRLKKIALDF